MNPQSIRMIKDRLDFVELVGRYVHLRPAGERWVAPCPFHHETKPSFHVNPGQGFYYCFGCQASGDIIDFYARINGLDFKQAVVQLARETGVELDFGPMDPREKKNLEDRQIFLRMYAQSAEHFQRNLESNRGENSRRYLRERRVNAEMLAEFGIGWSRPDWHGLEGFLRSRGYAKEQAVTCGLLVQNEQGRIYDRFRDRIMFPIHDLAGRIVAFGGRAIDSSEPKYINTSETPIYTKGEHLYGLHQARRAVVRDKRALLTEGYLDVVALHQFGFAQAVGVLGTALTHSQVKRLSGFCSRVDLVFDGDQAGLKAAVRAAEMLLARGAQCAVVTLPEGEDVDSLLHGQGPDVLRTMISQARDGLDFCLQTIQGYSPREVVDWAGRFLGAVETEALRAFYLPRVASGLGMSELELRRIRRKPDAPSPEPSPAVKDPVRTLTAKERQLLAFAVCCPQWREQLACGGIAGVLENDWAKAFWEKLSGLGQNQDPSGFSAEEKRFFFQVLAHDSASTGREDAAAWEEVRAFLDKHQLRNRQKKMLQALRQAQNQGDERSVSELLKAYQDLAREA
ncbi:MAG TPA: DNA primase [Desulfonatronum sp.]|nr:DNA primase [Desulfonatronum sp.]